MAATANGFVPISEWPTLKDLANGFQQNLMPASSKLSGTTYNITFEDGTIIEHAFEANNVTWHILAGKGKGLKATQEYHAYEVRPGFFLINFYKTEYEEQVSLVLHSDSGRVFAAISGYDEKSGERRTMTHFSHASLSSSAVEPFPRTGELAGKRVLYRYTSQDWYEHVYFNAGTLSWHCLKGTENGLVDTEEYKAWKLDDQCYILFWSEKVMPVESIIVVDLKALRSTGRFFCWDPKPKSQVIVEFGSYATILGETTYPVS